MVSEDTAAQLWSGLQAALAPPMNVHSQFPTSHPDAGDDEVSVQAADDERDDDSEAAGGKDVAPAPHARGAVGEMHQRTTHEEQREGDDDLQERMTQMPSAAQAAIMNIEDCPVALLLTNRCNKEQRKGDLVGKWMTT